MNQGEIWLVNLDPTRGAEIQKIRPAIIVNNNILGRLPLKVIVPITDWKERYAGAAWMVRLTPDADNNLNKESAADCFQIRSVAQERLIRKLGLVKAAVMEMVRGSITLIISS